MNLQIPQRGNKMSANDGDSIQSSKCECVNVQFPKRRTEALEVCECSMGMGLFGVKILEIVFGGWFLVVGSLNTKHKEPKTKLNQVYLKNIHPPQQCIDAPKLCKAGIAVDRFSEQINYRFLIE